MDVDQSRERDETEAQRIDRNWIELLQELRIVQTGGQVLTGFLLVVPFQERFAELGGGARGALAIVLPNFGVAIAIPGPFIRSGVDKVPTAVAAGWGVTTTRFAPRRRRSREAGETTLGGP